MRIRSIKPEFWISESIGRLSRDTRLVFIGLWSLADDQGRFRADVRFIAGQLFPYDSDGPKTIKKALDGLQNEGCIVLFEANRSQYGAITGWKLHQKIDKPSQSRIPEPPSFLQPTDSTRDSDFRLERIREGSWEDRKGAGIGGEQGGESKEPDPKEPDLQADLPGMAPPPEPVAKDLVEVWNQEAAPCFPRCIKITETRKERAEARLKEHGLPKMRDVVHRINASDFCRGLNRPEPNPWVANFDWLIKPDTPIKVLEGKYDNRGSVNPPNGASSNHQPLAASARKSLYGAPNP